MKSTTSHFVYKAAPGEQMLPLMHRFHPHRALNATEWRGHEPGSCCITAASVREHYAGEPSVLDIEVTYRSKDYVSYVNQTRYEGWNAMILAASPEGTLLDAQGQPLADGLPAVYLPAQILPSVEFNDINFGEFINEAEVPPLEILDDAAVMAEITKGSCSISTEGTFVAPHRHRPRVKIILSNSPTGRGVDGFGTHILNINLATQHFEHVLMRELRKLVHDFIEGRISLNNSSNGTITLVDLGKALVDCSPNEDGCESWFDMLSAYTPVTFLNDLARELISVFKVRVAIVYGGGSPGLLLRHD